MSQSSFEKRIRESISSGVPDHRMINYPCQDAFDVLSSVAEVMRENQAGARVIDESGHIKLVTSSMGQIIELAVVDTTRQMPWNVTLASIPQPTQRKTTVGSRNELEDLCIVHASTWYKIARGASSDSRDRIS